MIMDAAVEPIIRPRLSEIFWTMVVVLEPGEDVEFENMTVTSMLWVTVTLPKSGDTFAFDVVEME